MKNVGLIGLLMMLLSTMVLAQGQGKKGKSKLSPEAKAALKELQEKEIYPAKKAMYDDFMGQLSAEDKAYLVEKRQEKEALKAEAKAVRQQLKKDRKAGKEVDSKTVLAPIREKQKALLIAMRPFLEAQQTTLDGIMRSLEKQQKEWSEKKKAIIEQYTTAEEQQKIAAQREKKRTKRAARAKENGVSAEDKQLMRAAKFVLWDGEMKKKKEKKRKGGRERKTAE
ncbi:MAG: hypothetical protein ACRBFS_08780 [Aureispira sp.]